MKRHLVSYKLYGFPTQCGNQTFDCPIAMQSYIELEKHKWASYRTFEYEVHWSGISRLYG